MDRDRPRTRDLHALVAEADDQARVLGQPWRVVWSGDPCVTCCALGHIWTLYKAPLKDGYKVWHRRCLACTRIEKEAPS